MNRKERRRTHKIRNEDIDVIKEEALKEFIRFANKRPWYKRLKIGALILFKRLRV